VPAASLDVVLDCMAEVAVHATFGASDLDAERRVVLEELRAADDDPADVADRQLTEALFPGHPLGREIMGSAESLGRLDVAGLVAYHAGRFCADGAVVASAGAVEHDRMCRWAAGLATAPETPAVDRRPPPPAAASRLVTERPTEQAHVEIGVRALPHGHPDRHALAVANHILGGGPSSALFLDVRDERGLAYDVWSAIASYTDTGLWTAGAAVAPAAAATVERLVVDHMERLAVDGPTEEEVVVARSYLIGSTELALDDHGSLSGWLGFGELYLGGARPVDGELAGLADVTPGDVRRVVAGLLGAADPVVSIVAPLGSTP
jgi:predicted Zn-dependent peptidase